MKETIIVLILVGILALCAGILMFLLLTSEQAPIRVHIESVGPTVEQGIAARREALKAMTGVDVR